jgi:hypothetical protein
MSYDISSKSEAYECGGKTGMGVPSKCDLGTQVQYYTDQARNNCHSKAAYGIEIGAPAYPSPTGSDSKYRLFATDDEVKNVINKNPGRSGFFWDLYKPPTDESMNGTTGSTPYYVSQQLCNNAKLKKCDGENWLTTPPQHHS